MAGAIVISYLYMYFLQHLLSYTLFLYFLQQHPLLNKNRSLSMERSETRTKKIMVELPDTASGSELPS